MVRGAPRSLYGALHRMAAEGLIEAVRTEQVGKAPARTVYAITSEGRKELRALRAEAFRQVSLRPDPVDLAVAMSSDLPAAQLRGLVEDRHRALSRQREFFRHEQDRAWAGQTTADSLILQHAIGRLDAEIRWHEDLLLAIPMLSAPAHRPRARRAATAAPDHAPATAGRTASEPGGMTVRPIRLFGDPVLRETCQPVTRFDDGLARLVTDLMDTCRLPGRAGLAAPQIGVDLRVFCYNVDGAEGYLINPELALRDGEQDGPEGCLSIPGLYLPVRRAAHAVATGVDLAGRPVRVAGRGELARCLQHELDHLDGQLYLDRLSPADRREALRFIRRQAGPAPAPDRG